MTYVIKKIQTDRQSIAEITAFLKDTFKSNTYFSEEFLLWQYTESPVGEIIGYNAYYDNQLVSHFAALPFNMNIYGKVYKGAACINVSTNEKHRGKKLFMKLGLATINYAKEKGLDFIAAVPNANSTHAFLTHFGCKLITSLDVKVGIGSNLYENINKACYKQWTQDEWTWRLNNPSNRYLEKEDKLYTPISFFAKTISQRPIGIKQERLNNNLGFRPVSLYIGCGANTKKGIYMKLPSFIKRPPFNFVFRDFTGRIPTIKEEDLFLQMIDLDTI